MTKKLKIINLVLVILVLGQSALLIYTSIVDKEDSNVNESVVDKEQQSSSDVDADDNSVQYTSSDVAEKVYNSTDGSYYLILWNDGTYSYTNDKHKNETMGTYTVVKDEIHLNYVFSIDRGSNSISSADDSVVLTDGEKVLKINSIYELYDEGNNIKLNTVNQPAREGGRNFYTELKALLK